MKRVIFLFIIAALIISCPLGESSKTGTLVIKLPGSSDSRSAISDEYANSLRFKIDCILDGILEKSIEARAGNTISISLPEGNWKISLTVYNAIDMIVGSDVVNVTVIAGRMSSVPISLKIDTGDIFYIYTVQELQKVGTGTDGWTLSANYRLMGDIDLTNVANWTAIGSELSPFNGMFDGNDNVISMLKINNNLNDQGLFGYIGVNGTVKKLGLEDVNIISGRHVGGIAGNNRGSIINSYVTGYIKGGCAGGIVGQNIAGAFIQNCYSESIVTGNDNLGGIAGLNYGTVENCYATGNVTGNNEYIPSEASRTFGGVLGNNSGMLRYSYATGVISGDQHVGGVVGHNTASGTVRNCVALNFSINRTGSNPDTNFGRIIGNSQGTTNNIRARSPMTVDGISINTVGGTGNRNGDNINFATEWNTVAFWTTPGSWYGGLPWSTNNWDFSNIGGNNLPILKDMPGIRTQAPVVTP